MPQRKKRAHAGPFSVVCGQRLNVVFFHGSFDCITGGATATRNTAVIAVELGDGVHCALDFAQIVQEGVDLFGHAAVNKVADVFNELVGPAIWHRLCLAPNFSATNFGFL